MMVFFGTLSERRFKGDALLEINGSSVVFEFGRGAWRLSERGFLHGHAFEFYGRVFACLHSWRRGQPDGVHPERGVLAAV